MTNNCDRSSSYGIPNYPVCSRHGYCDNGRCTCDSRWTGYSDLELIEGYDCDTNLDTLLIWAILDLVFTSIDMIVIAHVIIHNRIFGMSNWKKIRSIFLRCFYGMNLFGALYAIEKINDPSRAVIGGNVRVDIWVLGFTTLTCCGFSAFFISILKFLKNYSIMLSPITKARIYSSLDSLAYFAPIFPSKRRPDVACIRFCG
jgi:hypothetical protein